MAAITDLTIEDVSQADLVFDTRNPRLQAEDPSATQDEALAVLWRDFAVDEVALSIAANGYFTYEPLFVAREDGQDVVIEGNRRLAAVRLLLSSEERQAVGATSLPKISPTRRASLQTLPIIRCQRNDIWRYVGFKHVNGPQAWQSFAKAKYIAWVHNTLNVPLAKIAQTIGDKHTTVARLYRALMAVDQAESWGVYSLDDRSKRHFSFSHLYTGFDYAGIQSFVGLTPKSEFTKTPIPSARKSELGELFEWLYGRNSKSQPPVVISQNPDLRILDEVLQSPNGLAALRRGLPLKVSQDISKGDERLLRESLVEAKSALQTARGKLLSGYHGETDLLATADDIRVLAEDIHAEMEGQQHSAQTPSATRRRTPTPPKRAR